MIFMLHELLLPRRRVCGRRRERRALASLARLRTKLRLNTWTSTDNHHALYQMTPNSLAFFERVKVYNRINQFHKSVDIILHFFPSPHYSWVKKASCEIFKR